jgi:hypothetical protein
MQRERDVLEHAVLVISEQAAAADALVHEALDARLGGSHPVTLHAKMLRLELLNVKAASSVSSDSSCSTAPHAAEGCTGSQGSAWSRDTGRTESPRHTMSRWSEPPRISSA